MRRTPRPRPRRLLVRPVVRVSVAGKGFTLRVVRGRLSLDGRPVQSLIDMTDRVLTLPSDASDALIGEALLTLIGEVARRLNGRSVPVMKLLEL